MCTQAEYLKLHILGMFKGTFLLDMVQICFTFLPRFQTQDKLEDQPEIPLETHANRIVGDVYEVLEDIIRTNPDAEELDKILYDPNIKVGTCEPFLILKLV